MVQDNTQQDFGDLRQLFAKAHVVEELQTAWPSSFEVVSEFWRAPTESSHLTPRMKELILLAMHASATALNQDATVRHVDRAKQAGATDHDILDVLVSIIGLANHALYFSVPILEEELKAAGREPAILPPVDPEFEKIKENFLEVRGFWNSEREPLARLIPQYFKALTKLGIESWQRGSLTRKERELICVGIDCSVTHTYAPGLRIHMRNAIACGATREEILEVLQLAALLGVETFVTGANALYDGQHREGADSSVAK
jgi:alkylhydroperoxidase/carboxymuconolactone decarboxylase family protein YurZ